MEVVVAIILSNGKSPLSDRLFDGLAVLRKVVEGYSRGLITLLKQRDFSITEGLNFSLTRHSFQALDEVEDQLF